MRFYDFLIALPTGIQACLNSALPRTFCPRGKHTHTDKYTFTQSNDKLTIKPSSSLASQVPQVPVRTKILCTESMRAVGLPGVSLSDTKDKKQE